MLALAVATAGCATSPDAPPGLADTVPSLSLVRLSGVPVGTQRTWVVEDEGGARIVSARAWSVRLRDEPVAWTTTVDARVDGEGRLLDLVVTRDGVASPWTPPEWRVHLLEASSSTLLRAAGGETVTVEAWLPVSERAVSALVGPDPRGVRVDTDLGSEVWTLDPRGSVVSVHAGAVDVVPVDAIPAFEPADLPALLRLPTDAWPGASEARLLVARLDGVDPADVHFPPGQVAGRDGVRVERPLWHEVPRERRERLAALVDEVRARVRVEATPGPPDAARVLALGVGDCNEHAAALVALLHAHGVDARAVSGWVYADAGGLPGLYPHAWVEAWMGEPLGWLPVDPVLGQLIADATHIRARDGVAVLQRPVVTRVEMR